MAGPPFTFGIALTPRANARNWALVQALLDLTLASVLAQTDGDFQVVIAGHDRPRLPDDPRFSFVDVGWPVEPPGPHNDDSGRKKHAINEQLLERGGGLFMLLDADDWVDRHLVAAARASIGEDVAGAVIPNGCAVDLMTLHACDLPGEGVFTGEFHRLCGSSTVANLQPGCSDPVRRDPFTTLRSHHQWLEAAAAYGMKLTRLDVSAAYLINTSENHSDLHGPHAAWRSEFIAAVNAHGAPLDQRLAERFGQRMEALQAASRLARRAAEPPLDRSAPA